MSAPIPEPELKNVRDAIFAERKIQAIKLYRKYTGVGLKDAKDAVDELERKLRSESPQKFESGKGATKPLGQAPGVQAKKGCFAAMVAVFVVALAIPVAIAWVLRH